MANDNLDNDQISVANDSPKQELTSLQKRRKKMLDNTAKLVPGRLNVQKGTNFRKLLKTVNFILFGAKRTVNRIDQWRSIDKAKGKALDVIGQDWGVYRNGSDDDFYRFLIRFKQSQSRADGSINSLIRVISEALGADPKDIHISDVPGEPQAIKITGIPNAYLDTDQKLRFVLKNLQSSVSAGVRVTGISFADSASVIIRFGSAVITRSSYEIKDPSVSDKDFYVGGAGLQNESMTGGTPENMDKGVGYIGGAGLISTSGEVTAPLIISDNLWDASKTLSGFYSLSSFTFHQDETDEFDRAMPNLIPTNGASYISVKETGNTNIGTSVGRVAFFDENLKFISCPIQPDSKSADYSAVAAIPDNAKYVLLHTPWGNTGETDIRLIGQKSAQTVNENLYVDAKNFDDPSAWVYFSSWKKATNTYNGLSVMQTTNAWTGISQYTPVKAGETYTFSLYARYLSGTGNSYMYWQLNKNPQEGHSQATVDVTVKRVALTDQWQRYSATATILSDGYIIPRIERGADNDNTLQVAGLELKRVDNSGNLLRDPSFSENGHPHWIGPASLGVTDGYLNHNAVSFDETMASTGFVDMQQIIYSPALDNIALVKLGNWYLLSFYTKGIGSIGTFIYPDFVDTTAGGFADGQTLGRTQNDGSYQWNLANDWVRHTYAFKLKSDLTDNVARYVLFRTYAGSQSFICMPQLELGTYAHDWSPAPEDLAITKLNK